MKVATATITSLSLFWFTEVPQADEILFIAPHLGFGELLGTPNKPKDLTLLNTTQAGNQGGRELEKN